MSDIKAILRLPGGNACQGELTDVGLQSVTIEVPVRAVASLERGSRASLALHGAELTDKEVSDVHIETFRQEGNRGRVVLRYVEEEELSRILAKGVGKHFNRRGSFRIEPDAKAPVRVSVATESGAVEAQAIDVSGTGVAVAADAELAQRLPVDTRFDVTLSVPGSLRPLQFVAQVRYHRQEDTGLHVGLMFDPDRSRGYATTQEHLIDYIMRRQRELLRARTRK